MEPWVAQHGVDEVTFIALETVIASIWLDI